MEQFSWTHLTMSKEENTALRMPYRTVWQMMMMYVMWCDVMFAVCGTDVLLTYSTVLYVPVKSSPIPHVFVSLSRVRTVHTSRTKDQNCVPFSKCSIHVFFVSYESSRVLREQRIRRINFRFSPIKNLLQYLFPGTVLLLFGPILRKSFFFSLWPRQRPCYESLLLTT